MAVAVRPAAGGQLPAHLRHPGAGPGRVEGGLLETVSVSWEGAPPPAVALALACSLVSLLTALPVYFRGDVRRPEPAAAAVRGFFRDLKRIVAVREARVSLLAMAGLRGVVA